MYTEPGSPVTVLRSAAAFDPATERLASDATVVIEGTAIVDVGPRHEVRAPDGAAVYDLGERTVLPGFIDAHVHLRGTRSYDPADGFVVPHDLDVLRAARDCDRLLAAGFTTVRDCGSAIALSLRSAVAEGTVRGPDLVAAGPIISQTGGHSDVHYRPLSEVRQDPDTIIADGETQVRQAVRQVLRAGADFVKICTTGGIGSERDHPADEHFTVAEVEAIVDEAHRAGKRVAAHAQGKGGILTAARAGVDSVEHGYYLDQECATELLSHGTMLVPTCALIEVFAASLEDPRGLPPARARKQAEAVAVMPRGLRAAYEAGVPMAAGSDYLGMPGRAHGDNVAEMLTMIKHGISVPDALRFGTYGGAQVIGLDGVGVLQPGAQADIVAVPGDPLTDVAALRHVDFVMKHGHVEHAPAHHAVPA